ncbi:hypothetical protein LCGC14_0602940 [marine sediment metagenome]|uniref:Uncharacterized protein n=1 Tax=marine sediment metagenome TaxID=412755 RepID=A0A0F9RA66_9ZZZZ|nr:MAG: hypothetical protein Lokiarch_41950 [Candidatus Lokiarchaeum sp. GC14_75]
MTVKGFYEIFMTIIGLGALAALGVILLVIAGLFV